MNSSISLLFFFVAPTNTSAILYTTPLCNFNWCDFLNDSLNFSATEHFYIVVDDGKFAFAVFWGG